VAGPAATGAIARPALQGGFTMSITPVGRSTVTGAALAALLISAPGPCRARDGWSNPVSAPSASATSAAASVAHSSPAAALGRPAAAVTLGTPVPVAAIAPAVNEPSVATASYEPAVGPRGLTVRLQAPDPPPPPRSGPTPVLPPGTAPPVPPLSVGDAPPPPPPPGLAAPGTTFGGVAVDQPIKKSFWDRCKDVVNPHSPDSKCGGWFQSDHAFDNFCNCGDLISPVSMPFLFEDPRALTEVRPLFIYETVPNHNAAFGGGNAEFYGLQARIAICERWSIVLSELGAVSLNPHDSDVGLTDHTGFAEIRVGPKWTFYRNEQCGSVAAAGLTFDIPTGSKNVFQNTGSLSLDPYVTFGQTFGRTSYGTFNFLAEAGYWFSVDDKRTDYTHVHLHLDYDVANIHRIYPLMELNWLHTTSFGKENPDVHTEGADLVNFGSTSYNGKRDLVTLAFGARYKFGGSDHYQMGTAFEFPVTDRKDLQAFRFTLDFIFRY
jgi:hypothetical protein